jgi:hypothetical protein
MEKDTFTEEEAINITIQHGYTGSEFNTSYWKNKGRLSKNRTLGGLIQKLETIYHNVEVKGKGKKRLYILTDKKVKMTERKYNYKGKVRTENDEIMKEYIFKILTEKGPGNPKAYNKWGKEFNLLQINSSKYEQLIKALKDLHAGSLFNPKEVLSEFLKAINNYNYSIIKSSFYHLEKEERISQEIIYYVKTIDGHHNEVGKDEYDMITAFIKDLVESQGIDYIHYINSYRSYHKNNNIKSFLEEVKRQLNEHFKIEYAYERIKVVVKDNKENRVITRDEFNQAFFQKFIKLSMNRQNRVEYKTSESFWKSFYLMNTLVLLSIVLQDMVTVEGLEELKYEEMKKKSAEGFLDYVGDFELEFE